ncbi:hypothetical protein SLS62_002770 [Diatrype stigma]|uniref:Fe2OG dioxygenase domain-containing protein n=1 Tax=Diatrype stigma TaxID=117547 RepID=A0AAN9UU15_9PEZI
MSKKRTIDAFFGTPKPKKTRVEGLAGDAVPTGYSTHRAYPFPIARLPARLSAALAAAPAPGAGRAIADQPDLDLLYFEPYVPRPAAADELFRFLRAELPFYRVEYDIRRGGISAHIRTPRWTTVFGIDATSRFSAAASSATNTESTGSGGGTGGEGDDDVHIVDAHTGARVQTAGSGGGIVKHYDKYAPRPIPGCLDELRRSAEAATGCDFNFCLVNYYESGADSISYHSDDERFLGPRPAIASFSLGARRDFLMKHKPGPEQKQGKNDAAKPLKLPLASGDMVLMRGPTQANWLHSIPKRSGKNEQDGGRINITFRKAMVKGGTENYYNYNVGAGPVYRWDSVNREMKLWNP